MIKGGCIRIVVVIGVFFVIGVVFGCVYGLEFVVLVIYVLNEKFIIFLFCVYSVDYGILVSGRV